MNTEHRTRLSDTMFTEITSPNPDYETPESITLRDEWDAVEYTCLSCELPHHPDDRVPHPFRISVSCCPDCDSTRFHMTHDFDGLVE